MSKFDNNNGGGNLGPMRLDWSQADQRGALELVKELLLALGSLDFKCFVATAVYGDPSDRRLISLRRFRDRVLLRTEAGQRLVAHYYRHGPSWAAWVKDKPWVASLIRAGLDRVSTCLAQSDPDKLAVEPLLQIGIWAGAHIAGRPEPPGQKTSRPWGEVLQSLGRESWIILGYCP